MIGIDPGTGSSSPTGIAIFDPQTLEIIYTTNLFTKHKILQHRLKDITSQLVEVFNQVPAPFTVCIEQFVMRGKGGETLQRLIGAFMSQVPYSCELIHCQNTTVKAKIGGHGQADKVTVGRGLEAFFTPNKDSVKLIKELTDKGEVDIIDALAIGATGWIKLKDSLSIM